MSTQTQHILDWIHAKSEREATDAIIALASLQAASDTTCLSTDQPGARDDALYEEHER